MYDYLIVGAGFAGSVLAERLANGLGKKVLICDTRPHIGGNAYDHYNDDGILIHKYGPHIFHTNSQDVFDYLNKKIGPSEQTAYVEKGADEADKTYADTSKLRRAIGFAPDTSMQDGLEKFVDWFKHYK